MRKSTVLLLSSYNRTLSTTSHGDFFGIAHITSKDIAGAFKSRTKLNSDELQDRYQALLKKRKLPANEVIERDVTFGTIRFDKDNLPQKHGQYEPSNEAPKYETIDVKQLFVPEVQEAQTTDQVDSFDKDNTEEKNLIKNVEGYREAYRIADVEPTDSISHVLQLFNTSRSLESVKMYINQPPMTFFFENPLPSNDEKPGCNIADETNQRSEQQTEPTTKLSGHRLEKAELESTIIEASLDVSNKPILVYDPDYDKKKLESLEDFDVPKEELELKFDKSLDEKYDYDPDEPTTSMGALDYLKKVRAQKIEPSHEGLKCRIQNENTYPIRSNIKLDSKGFRNYTSQVPNWHACRHIDILNHIKKSIVYHNYDILAVNKPYGIASHDEERSREPLDMNNLMQEIATSMRIEKVYLAHRLDKTTTGVLLFATSQERARHLNKLFKSDQIKKTYWCITKGVPDPPHAIIDIPVGEYTVAGKSRSCVVPESVDKDRQLSKHYREARRAITEYKVIDSTMYASIVEVKPRTGVKHQIRCHLSFGIGNQILGDHKYSNVGKIAPQVLPAPLLKQLQVRQTKVRTLPVHLHAKSVVIPGAKANGETLFITAPLPNHFIENMKSLKLKVE